MKYLEVERIVYFIAMAANVPHNRSGCGRGRKSTNIVQFLFNRRVQISVNILVVTIIGFVSSNVIVTIVDFAGVASIIGTIVGALGDHKRYPYREAIAA
jgi:hypothetical protein